MAISDLTKDQLYGQMFDSATGAVRTIGSGGGGVSSAITSPVGQGSAAAALSTTPAVVSTASITTLASTAASQQLLAANAARTGLILVNTDANQVRVKYGTTASASSFTFIVPGNFGQWEMPEPVYTGRLDAIWDADGTGSLISTEL